ncbi:MAG: adenylate kinase [bacterium]|nr:adenylate kinase [Acidimicrobiia bacterium]MCY4651373.1 adenylate kinase [bacterium]
MRLLFVGPPGSGKGTQAVRVAESLGIPHISTGEMFRSHVTRGTELGKTVKELMAAGEYVPDEITGKMLAERLTHPDAARGFILDGFPRTIPQAELLDDLLSETPLDRVVLLAVDEEELMARMLSRGRADDTAETIRRRLEVYESQTAPLLDLYGPRGLLERVDGSGDMNEITGRIMAALR